MMESLRRAIVLSGSIGKGHDTISDACVAALGPAVDAPILDSIALLGDRGGAAGEWVFRQLLSRPSLYDGFHFGHLRRGSKLARALDTVALRKMYAPFEARANALQPQLILAVFATGAAAAARYKRSNPAVVTSVICTDSFAHHMWVQPGIDVYLATSPLGAAAIRMHDPGAHVEVVTHPVRPEFHHAPPKGEARRALGVPDTARCVLVMSGGWGIGPLDQLAARLANDGVHVLGVAGSNAALFRRLSALASREPRVHAFGYTERIPELMAAADVVITSSGDTCREARVVGRWLIILDVVPGHGRENLQHELELGGAAAVQPDADAVRRAVHLALEQPPPAPARDAAAWAGEFRAALAPFFSGGAATPTAR